MKRLPKITLIIALTALLSAASADRQKRGRPGQSSRAAGPVELRSLEPLKTAFQRDTDKVRLVTLLSPT